MRSRFSSLLWMLTLVGCGRVNEIAAVDDAGTQTGGTGGNSGGGNAGTTGSGGSGGASGSGSGGTGATTAEDLSYYYGCDMPTGAIRFAIYKSDPVRDLCFQIVVSNVAQQFGEIQVTPDDYDVESAHVRQSAAECGITAEPVEAVNAIGGTGTIELSPILTNPPQLDVDVTLEFPQSKSWVPASEPIQPGKLLGMDPNCASCATRSHAYKTLVDQTRQSSPNATVCTSMLRFAYQTLEPIAHAINCAPFAGVTESQALATAESALQIAPGAVSLAGSSSQDQFVFRGTSTEVIPEADKLGAAVSQHSGLLTFGVRLGWSNPGGVEFPTSWRPGTELGGGCPIVQQPVGSRGFDLNQATSLPTSEVDTVVAKAFSTAMPAGILESWGLAGMDAVVLRYSPQLGFDPTNAEYVVLVNHWQIVVN